MKNYVFSIQFSGGLTVPAKNTDEAFEKAEKILADFVDECAWVPDGDLTLRLNDKYLEDVYKED